MALIRLAHTSLNLYDLRSSVIAAVNCACLNANTEHLSFSLKDRIDRDTNLLGTCFTVHTLFAYQWPNLIGLTILAICAGNIKALV